MRGGAFVLLLIGLIGLLTACAGVPPAPETSGPPLPFARGQDIPMQGASVRPTRCGGEVGLNILTADRAWQIMLMERRAIIADNRPGDELPVWFVTVDEDGGFHVAFVLSFAKAHERYLDPCDWLRPGPAPTPSGLLRAGRPQAAPGGPRTFSPSTDTGEASQGPS